MLTELQLTYSKATPLGKTSIRKSKTPFHDQRVNTDQMEVTEKPVILT